MESKVAREDPQLKLRLTEEMKSKVSDAAKLNGRSVNAEIVARLDASFSEPRTGPIANEVKATLDQIYDMLEDTLDIDEWALAHGYRTRSEALEKLAEVAIVLDNHTASIKNGWLQNGDRVVDAMLEIVRVAASPSQPWKVLNTSRKAIEVFIDAWKDIGIRLGPVIGAVEIMNETSTFGDAEHKVQTEIAELKSILIAQGKASDE